MVAALSRRLTGCVRSAWPAASQARPVKSASTSARAYASTSSSQTEAQDEGLAPALMPGQVPNALPSRLKPASPSYYTSKPVFSDSLIELDDLTRRVRRTLQLNAVRFDSPLLEKEVAAARKQFVWPKVKEMSRIVKHPLGMSDHRTLHQRLNQLVRYRYFVEQHMSNGSLGVKARELAEEYEKMLKRFNSVNVSKEEVAGVQYGNFLSGSSGMDNAGRAYARGRRKESHARVWIIPSHNEELTSLVDPSASKPSNAHPNNTISTSVLVNSKPLSEYFTRQVDREKLLYPLRAVGMTGVFNVFALTAGGGSTGQAGAVEHGLARALVTFFDDKARLVENAEGLSSPAAIPLRTQAVNIRELLARTGILTRDRRMVERKKTNQPKARKHYAWVKR